jgi:hypothetical protein
MSKDPEGFLLNPLPTTSESNGVEFPFYGNSLSARQNFRCYASRYCRRLTCEFCMSLRRNKFIEDGTRFSMHHDLNYFVTQVFPLKLGSDAWTSLYEGHFALWKKSYRHPAPKFIRCLAMDGSARHPHAHYILHFRQAELMQHEAEKLGYKETHLLPIEDHERILGYLFDQNFKSTATLPNRPKGFRLLMASRGMKCGFPDPKKIRSML